MKKWMLYTLLLLPLLSTLLTSNVQSADEQPVHIYVNQKMLANNGIYFNEANITVRFDCEERMKTSEISVYQDGRKMDIEMKESTENFERQFLLTKEGNYTFHIQTEKDELLYDAAITIFNKIPVYLNDQPLQDFHETTSGAVLRIPNGLDMAASYIVINGVTISWTQDNGNIFHKMEEGLKQLEFHFVDASGSAIVQKATIAVEFKDIKADLFLNDEELHEQQKILPHDAKLSFRVQTVSPASLRVMVNEETENVEWKLTDHGYEGILYVMGEGVHDVQLLFEEPDVATVLGTCEIIIDKTAPIAYLEYEDAEYVNEPVAVTIYIEDRWFCEASFFSDTVDGNEKRYQDWKPVKNGYEQKVELVEDGRHELGLYGMDLAGNPMQFEIRGQRLQHWEKTIVLDTSTPVITSNLIQNHIGPISGTKTIAYCIADEHLDENAVNLQVKRDAEPYDAKLYQEGTCYKTVLEEDGTYVLEMHAKDLAGNQQIHPAQTVILDSAKPSLQLENLTGNLTNQDVEIRFTAVDANPGMYEVHITRDRIPLQTDMYRDNEQRTYILHEDEGVHTYEIIVKGEDMAGNHNTASLRFIIDKELPSIHAFLQQKPYEGKLLTNTAVQMQLAWQDDNYWKAELLQYYNGELVDQRELSEDQFQRYVSALASRNDTYEYRLKVFDLAGNVNESEISFQIDTRLANLKIENDIFQGKPAKEPWLPILSEDEKTWTILDTFLKKDQKDIAYEWGMPITEDGLYTLDVLVQDEAGNIGMLQKPFHFEIDTTPPLIDVYLNSEKVLDQLCSGSPADLEVNSGFMKEDMLTSLKLNGIEQLDNPRSSFHMYLKSGTYQLEISAEDAAGNQSTRQLTCQIQDEHRPVYASAALVVTAAFLILAVRKRCMS